MHAGELVQLAAILATHGGLLVRDRAELAASGLQEYWTASKCRHDRWSRVLADYNAAGKHALIPSRWQAVRPIVEEILLSEVLVRVWTAVLASYDRYRGAAEAEPIARSVLIGQMEARHRAMKLLVYAPGVRIADAIDLNRLRRKAERWTDLLLANLARSCRIDELASDPARARDFAADLEQDVTEGRNQQTWPILLASLRSSIASLAVRPTSNADLNERIAASILACFPGELFDSTCQFHSLWVARLRYAADDAQGMIDQLWNLETTVAAPQSRPAESEIEQHRRRVCGKRGWGLGAGGWWLGKGRSRSPISNHQSLLTTHHSLLPHLLLHRMAAHHVPVEIQLSRRFHFADIHR